MKLFDLNNKFLTILLIPFLVCACGSPKEPEWLFNATMHWKEKDGEIIEQATHRYDEWIIDIPATCEKEGSKYLPCLICGYHKAESIPKLGHNYGNWIIDGEESYRVCSICGDVQKTIREQTIFFKTPLDGETIDLCEPTIRDLLNNKDDDKYVATHHMANRYCSTGKTYDNQSFVDIEFIDSKSRNAQYTLTLASDSEFQNIVDTYVTTKKSIRLEGILNVGTTYYYKIDVDDGDYSAVDSFTTLDSPVRFISCGSVLNVRDIGGWETSDHKHVKYGLIYRGAGLNDAVSSMNQKSRDVLRKLKMRGELDLRNGASTQNAWDSSLPHLCVNGGWYTSINDDQDKINALRASLNFLANEDNYPSYFHCSYGMDRTGTLAYILLGLLGVSENDLYLDYELSDYSAVTAGVDSHCERAVIEESRGGGYEFNYAAGSYPDGTPLRTPIYKCLKHFKDNYKADTLQASIQRYLLERVKISEKTINTLKENLLE